MSKVPESSKLTLYAGVEVTQGQQVVFGSKAGQEAYFKGKEKFSNVLSSMKFSYLRRTRPIKVQLTMAQVSQCDYLSFINPAFENKRIYAKIVDYEYISNTVTKINYAIDYFQTYMFDVAYEPCTITREHMSEAGHQIAVENPYTNNILELQTPEALACGKEFEKQYLYDNVGSESDVLYYPNAGDESDTVSSIVLQIAEFDKEQIPSYYSEFLNYFNSRVTSNGIVFDYAGADRRVIPVNVGRGYELYEITLPRGASVESFENLKKALNWLTLQGLAGSIISIFQVSYDMWRAYTGAVDIEEYKVYPRAYKVNNPKLLRFPFQYLRTYNNEGDCKEYKYEDFYNLALGNDPFVVFRYAPMFDGSPMVSLLPYSYKRVYNNPEERMDSKVFPQVGYTTDAYLAFLAQQYGANMSTRTSTVSEGLAGLLSVTEQALASGPTTIDEVTPGDVKGFMNYLGHGFVSGVQTIGKGAVQLFSSDSLGDAAKAIGSMPTANERAEVDTWRSGGEVPSSIYSAAKAAFVADNYVAGNGNGMIGYYMGSQAFAPGTFTFVRVALNSVYLNMYDKYFDLYGYTSGRIGVPRVCNYIKGSGDVPHFAETSEGVNTTYVKTDGMHVLHSISEVASSIEGMFNSGCRFVKGD